MRASKVSTLLVHVPMVLWASLASAQTGDVRTGASAFADWTVDAPGVRRLIRPSDLPAPKAAQDPEASIGKNAKVIDPPQGETEAIYLMDALWQEGRRDRLTSLLSESAIADSEDPSVSELRGKYRARLKT